MRSIGSDRVFDTAVYVTRWDPIQYRWGSHTLLRDAQIRQLDDHGLLPGARFDLRVPSIDDETGDVLNVDGDRSYDHTEVIAGDLSLHGGTISLTGFTSDERHAAFRLIKLEQIPYAWVAARDTERLANHSKLSTDNTFTFSDAMVVVAMRKYALAAEKAGKDSWVRIPEHETVNLSDEGADSIPLTRERVADLQARGLVMVSEKFEWSRKRRAQVPVLGVHLLTIAEDYADVEHDRALERDA